MRFGGKTLAALTIGGLLASGLVVAAALSPGYEALHPELDDGSVWVANQDLDAVGRINTGISGIDSVIALEGRASEIVQTEDTIVVLDRLASTLRVIDPVLGNLSDPVPIPAGADVLLEGDNAAVLDHATGDVWLMPSSEIGAFQTATPPTSALGEGAEAVLYGDYLYAASPGLGSIVTIEIATGETINSDPVPMSPNDPQLVVSANAAGWIVFDSVSGSLSTPMWEISTDDPTLAIQVPAQNRGVVAASNEGLVRFSSSSGEATVLAGGTNSTPVRPLVISGCIFGVWAEGAGIRQCGLERNVLTFEGFEYSESLAIANRKNSLLLTSPETGNSWTLGGEGVLVNDWGMSDPHQTLT
ncbi:hypothetical protein [Humidisolicoccus flavus]|uniref:hypothetical protein n=1 Tax=Humidisolicoccus flavus TaxID=3111414 RepID=UPI0032521BD2